MHDPNPVVIMLYALDGIHPNTGNQWRFFQAINFTYIPRMMRKQFANDWVRVFKETNGKVQLTWDTVKKKYPYLQNAVRRYFFKPSYYIQELKEVPFEQMEQAIISTWNKDFSKKLKVALWQKFRKAMKERKNPNVRRI